MRSGARCLQSERLRLKTDKTEEAVMVLNPSTVNFNAPNLYSSSRTPVEQHD